MVTVYTWTNNIVGHASVWADDQYLSFHPRGFNPLSIASERDLLSNAQFDGCFSSNIDDDIETYGTRHASYALGSINEDAVREAILLIKQKKPKYAFYTFNCSDAVILAIQHGIQDDDDDTHSLIDTAKSAWQQLFPTEVRGASLADGLSQSIMQNISKVAAAANTKGPVVRKATAVAVALAH